MNAYVPRNFCFAFVIVFSNCDFSDAGAVNLRKMFSLDTFLTN